MIFLLLAWVPPEGTKGQKVQISFDDLVVESDWMEWNGEALSLRKNIKARFSDLQVQGNRLTLTLKKKRVHQLWMGGTLEFHHPQAHGSAEELRWLASSDWIQLEGQVRVENEDFVFQGESLSFSTKDQLIRCVKACSVRRKGVE